MINPIRIRTSFGDKRVFTLFHNGLWVTMGSDLETKETANLMQAGINHLESALILKGKSDV